MQPQVFLRFALALLFGASAAVLQPRDSTFVNSTRVVDDTTIYYPGPVDLRVRSAPATSVASSVPNTTAVLEARNTDTDDKPEKLHEGSNEDPVKRTAPHKEGKEGTPTSTARVDLTYDAFRNSDSDHLLALFLFAIGSVALFLVVGGYLWCCFRRADRKAEAKALEMEMEARKI